MFVTSGNQCYALDAGTGRQIWRFSRPLTKGLVGNAAGGINRGAAVDRTHAPSAGPCVKSGDRQWPRGAHLRSL
jgi:glucose dehydrogenase